MGETDSYGHRSTGEVCLSKPAGNSVNQVAQRLSNEFGGCVPTPEGGLGAHGLGSGRPLDRPLINVGRESRQFSSDRLAQQAAQNRAAGLGQLADRKYPRLVQAPFCRRSDAPHQPDGKRVEKVALIAGSHDHETVRLGHLRRHLGEVLGASHADRQRESDLVAYASTDSRRYLSRCSEETEGAGNIEKCLIYGHPLHSRSEVMKDRHDFVAELLVTAELATDEEKIATKLAGPPPGHAARTP